MTESISQGVRFGKSREGAVTTPLLVRRVTKNSLVRRGLRGRQWVDFKLSFLEKDVYHDQKINISRDLSQIAIQICLKICAIPTDLDFGVLSIKSMFLVFF